METPKNNQNGKNWIEDSILLKLGFIILIIILMLIPLESVKDVIKERNYRHIEAINEISSKWGSTQTVNAVVLSVPYDLYEKIYSNKEKNVYSIVKTTHYAHFLPEKLNIKGNIKPEKRYRGIFSTVVYSSELSVDGTFSHPDFSEWQITDSETQRIIRWDDAFVSLGITDLSAIQEDITLNWGDTEHELEPIDNNLKQYLESMNLSTPVSVCSSDTSDCGYNFSMKLNFKGSASLNFTPMGRTTTVSLSSPWNNPSFNGRFLPDDRNVDDKGFNATWKILQLNRDFPQKFDGTFAGTYNSVFGVQLLLPVDDYQISMRAVKYAILLISLMFLAFFFIQILRKIRMHPLQYLLIGFALCLFYVLLISISEHLSFNTAYGISAFLTTLLVVLYVKSIFKNKQFWQITAGILILLYTFIFSILQLQDYSLLMGSIGLFIALAVVMYLSRNVDWYHLSGVNQKNNNE